VRLHVLARHAHSLLNEERRVNGDPSRPVPLTELGREEARMLGVELSALPLDVCLHTRFGRTSETAELVLACRAVPLEVEPLLDDIRIGELEGKTIDDYRAWKRQHTRDDPFPGGESLNDAARRYARAYRRLAESEWTSTLVVCHEIPIRYALNAVAGSDDFDVPVHDIPNATPFLFSPEELLRAAERIEELAGPGY
jgi:broad specificity phosphatase PhoE